MVPYRGKSYFQTEISFRKRSIYTQLDFQMSIGLVLTKRELSFFQILPSLNMIVFPNTYFGKCQHFVSFTPGFSEKKNTTIIEYDCISKYFGKCQHFVSFKPGFSEKEIL